MGDGVRLMIGSSFPNVTVAINAKQRQAIHDHVIRALQVAEGQYHRLDEKHPDKQQPTADH